MFCHNSGVQMIALQARVFDHFGRRVALVGWDERRQSAATLKVELPTDTRSQGPDFGEVQVGCV